MATISEKMRMSKANEDRRTELVKDTAKSSRITYREVLLLRKKVLKELPRRVDPSSSRHPKTCYTRDFLLSLSQLGVCKMLPGGFNQSTSCNFDAACTSLFDMQKVPGSWLSHKSLVSRHGSSSAARGDSGNSSRGSGGKRDSHSLGRNNQDRGSQCDRDSGDGSRYGPQPQYLKQVAGDGLLESGTSQNVFPCAAGASAPKFEARHQYELRKSDNPYRPSHFSKEVGKARRGSDSCTKAAHNYAESLNKRRAENENTKRGSVTSKLDGFPSSAADDNFLKFCKEYGSAVISSEGIEHGNHLEIPLVENTRVNLSYDDQDWAEIVSMLHLEQESKLSAIPLSDPISNSKIKIYLPGEDKLIKIDDTQMSHKPKFMPEIAPNLQRVDSKLYPLPDSNESAFDYCLPDEDSLISFDDVIIPQHSVSPYRGSLSKDCMLPSNVNADVSDKYLAQNVMHWDEGSSLPGYYGVTGLENLYHNQQSHLSYPQFCHSQINQGQSSFQGLYQMNCPKKFRDPKTTCGTSPLKHHFNAKCRPSGSKAKSKKPDPFSCYSLLQQPAVSPHYQQNELHMAQVTSLAQGLSSMEIWPSMYQQLSHEGFRLPNPDPSGGAGYSNQVWCNSFIQTNWEQSCHGGSKQLG